MISRRFFLKAVGAGLLGASAAGRAVAARVPVAVVPDPADGGVIEVLAASGTRLCSIPLRVGHDTGRVTLHGCDAVVTPGTAAVVRWRLPGGRMLEGTAGIDPSCDLHMNMDRVVPGSLMDVKIVIEDIASGTRSTMVEGLAIEAARGSWRVA